MTADTTLAVLRTFDHLVDVSIGFYTIFSVRAYFVTRLGCKGIEPVFPRKEGGTDGE